MALLKTILNKGFTVSMPGLLPAKFVNLCIELIGFFVRSLMLINLSLRNLLPSWWKHKIL